MFLLTSKFVKKSHIYANVFFIFLKKIVTELQMLLIPNFNHLEKTEKVVTKQSKI